MRRCNEKQLWEDVMRSSKAVYELQLWDCQWWGSVRASSHSISHSSPRFNFTLNFKHKFTLSQVPSQVQSLPPTLIALIKSPWWCLSPPLASPCPLQELIKCEQIMENFLSLLHTHQLASLHCLAGQWTAADIWWWCKCYDDETVVDDDVDGCGIRAMMMTWVWSTVGACDASHRDDLPCICFWFSPPAMHMLLILLSYHTLT